MNQRGSESRQPRSPPCEEVAMAFLRTRTWPKLGEGGIPLVDNKDTMEIYGMDGMVWSKQFNILN